MTLPMTFYSRYTLFISLVLFLGHFSLSAQTPLDKAMRSADVNPAWPGCDPKMTDCTKLKLASFITSNLVLPSKAKAEGAGGLVAVEFVIEKNGEIGEVKALHDPGFGLGDEATRVVKLMAEKDIKWIPARKDGKKVPFRYMVPVPFNLSAPPKEVPKPQVETSSKPMIYDVAEVMPRYAGCDQVVNDTIDCTFTQMIKHIQQNIQYPKEALAAGASGPVVVDFVVDADGQVKDPVVSKSIGFGLDQEAIRIVSIMPKWTPGMEGGKPVAVRMTIPIIFQIPKDKD
jgi:TonB family protein